jgi:Cupin-like domain
MTDDLLQEIDCSDLAKIAEMIEKRQPFLVHSAKINYVEIEKIPRETVLQVESKWKKQFGSGRKSKMTFGEFMDNITTDEYYLSTQYEDNLEDLVRQVLMPPLDKVVDDLTIKLPFSFNLILQQMNVWIGSGSNNSSGLHHDFHDNFYFLQKGIKKFRLYSPEQYNLMYLHGNVTRLHENGLIVYNGENIRQDGAYCQDVAAWKVSKAEELLENATTESEIEKAELDMDVALEESLQFQQDESDDECDDAVDENDNITEEIKSDCPPIQKKLKMDDTEPHFPPSFSKIPASALQDHNRLSSDFPEFLKAKVIEVTVNPGQVLFIPAGWFHEVRSSVTQDDYHLALNYWYAPLAIGRSVQNPYNDDYWMDVHQKPFDELMELHLN